MNRSRGYRNFSSQNPLRGLTLAGILLGTFAILLLQSLTIGCKQKTAVDEFHIPDYKNWRKPVETILEYPVPGHGTGARRIFANELSYQPIVSSENNPKKIIMREGSIIIKEQFPSKKDIGKKEPVIYVMRKSSRLPGAIEGWLYYVKQPGSSLKCIETKLCYGCHEAANDMHPYFDKNKNNTFRDYLFVPFTD